VGQELRGELRAFSSTEGATGPVVTADLSATLPIDRWVTAGEVVRIPSTAVHARFDGLNLNEVPYACGYGTGPIYGTASLEDLFTERPQLRVIADLPQLRL